jgi:hypothetical protein
MTDSAESNPLWRAVQLNARRRERRYAEHRAAGKAWMIECRDMWDAEDDDAGVYFVGCADAAAVTRYLNDLDPSSDRVLGIYDLSKPLVPQGPGLTREEWKAR